jgi:hypothetical protein
VNPVSGDLAVVANKVNGYAAILVYRNATGTPAVYALHGIEDFGYTAYDGSGNLFSTALTRRNTIRMAELPTNKTKVKLLRVVGCAPCNIDKLQWDGKYLVFNTAYNGASYLSQLAVSASAVTVVGSVQPEGFLNAPFWIYDGLLFGRYTATRPGNNEPIAVWTYPSNGKHIKAFYNISKGNKNGIADVTVSVPSSQ